PFSLSAKVGALTAPAMFTSQIITQAAPGGQSFSAEEIEAARMEAAFAASETRLRNWERENLGYNDNSLFRTGPQGAPQPATPNLGDFVTIKVPDIGANPCSDFITITGEVMKVGTYGIFIADTLNPTDDPLTATDYSNFSTEFDNDIYPVLSANFGTPTDIDANGGRVLIVLTREVNRFSNGVAGFVYGGDLYPTTTCASSDLGEIFYGYVPDPSNTVGGPYAQTKTSVVNNMPALIAHEVTHVIQQSLRFASGGGFAWMKSWEAEGQADLAKQLLGFQQRSHSYGQNYDGVTLATYGLSESLYAQRFSRLARYFGWDISASDTVANAPQMCSLYGYTGGTVPCTSAYYYGAGWSFHQWIVDQFSSGYTGGAAQLQKDWISLYPGLSGRANVEALVGVSFDTLFAEWAAMLYVDDRVAGVSPNLQMTSWNLYDIHDLTFAWYARLHPTMRTWGSFSHAEDVRGGSTHYTVLSSAGARGALAVRLRDQADAILGAGMKPVYWVVRMQ
ncbi:MAG: hypothetical protein OEZ54_07845, partial [Gemmatimonadota bacterium]|nr:hypothetical protein [Gemmatimonadota bacterium]